MVYKTTLGKSVNGTCHDTGQISKRLYDQLVECWGQEVVDLITS